MGPFFSNSYRPNHLDASYTQLFTGDEFYQFFHMTSAQGLLGIMKTGQYASLFHHSKQQSGVMLSGCATGGHTKYPWSSTWVELNFATREAYLFSVVFAWAPASVSQTPGLLHHFRSCVVMKCAVCLRSKQSLTLFLKN